MDAAGAILGFTVTLMVLSYLLGDNALYRLAIYIFIGLTAAFVTIITIETVLLPLTTSTGGVILLGVAAFFGLLLLLKPARNGVWLTNLVLAFLVAVGVAVALVGALTGALLPLTSATIQSVDREPLAGAVMVTGVVTSLIYFQYLARRGQNGLTGNNPLIAVLRTVGQGFIVVALGTAYGLAILSGLTIMSGRIAALLGGGI
jgi:hypothetical protein